MRPLLIVTNGGPHPYHELAETHAAYTRTGELERPDILPFDAMGFHPEPDTSKAMSRAIEWFDEHLRQATLPTRSTPVPERRRGPE